VTTVAPTESEQFAAATFDAFAAGYDASPVATEERWQLAGRMVRTRYVAPALAARFHPTLAHLDQLDAVDDADLEIGCWDRSLTAVAAPPPPWGLDDYLPEARIRGHVDGRVRATFDATARVLSLYDRDARRAVLHVASSATVPDWMDRAPFRTILTWWAADRGLAMVHASAVAWGDGAVLLAGGSGAGKSTTAMACLAGGLDLLGDDACLVGLDPTPHLWSVYRRAKLEPDAARWLPSLDALVVVRTEEQTHIDPGARHRHDAPLRAVLLPQVTNERTTRAVPIARAEAMRVLTATTLLEGGGMARAALTTLAALARDVPCLRLELGRDLDGVAAAVRTVIEAHA
jgi:hypothetical protein